jgi:two-component system response regulator MprA
MRDALGPAILDRSDRPLVVVDEGPVERRRNGIRSASKASVRILVVDDAPALRSSLGRALSHEGYDVLLSPDGNDALRAVTDESPAVVILDAVMPGLNGFDVCRSLRLSGDSTPVLMLTVRDGVADRVAGLDAGADDYLVKPFALEELLARTRALIRRSNIGLAGEELAYEHLRVDPSSREAWSDGARVDLSRTEFDLLALFVNNPRRVLSRQVIMHRVWGFDLGATSNTLAVYVGYLRRKLEHDGAPRLIHTVRGVGYVLRRA